MTMSKTEQLDYIDTLLMQLPEAAFRQHIEAIENDVRRLGATVESLELSPEERIAIKMSDLELDQGLGLTFKEAEAQTDAFLASLR